jgi:hypothetical protein
LEDPEKIMADRKKPRVRIIHENSFSFFLFFFFSISEDISFFLESHKRQDLSYKYFLLTDEDFRVFKCMTLASWEIDYTPEDIYYQFVCKHGSLIPEFETIVHWCKKIDEGSFTTERTRRGGRSTLLDVTTEIKKVLEY